MRRSPAARPRRSSAGECPTRCSGVERRVSIEELNHNVHGHCRTWGSRRRQLLVVLARTIRPETFPPRSHLPSQDPWCPVPFAINQTRHQARASSSVVHRTSAPPANSGPPSRHSRRPTSNSRRGCRSPLAAHPAGGGTVADRLTHGVRGSKAGIGLDPWGGRYAPHRLLHHADRHSACLGVGLASTLARPRPRLRRGPFGPDSQRSARRRFLAHHGAEVHRCIHPKKVYVHPDARVAFRATRTPQPETTPPELLGGAVSGIGTVLVAAGGGKRRHRNPGDGVPREAVMPRVATAPWTGGTPFPRRAYIPLTPRHVRPPRCGNLRR